MAAMIVIGVIVPRLVHIPGWLLEKVHASIFALAMLAMGLFCAYLVRRRAAVFLRGELITCGVPVCFCCGYYLRGLVEDRCPECGSPLDEKIEKLIEQDAKGEEAGGL